MSQRHAFPLVGLCTVLLLGACTPSDGGGPITSGTGGTGGSVSTGTGGTTAGTGGQVGSGGTGGGSGGMAPGGSGGSGGTAGSEGDGSAPEVTPEVSAETGAGVDGSVATDPGTMGNGRFMIARPAPPPETMGNATGTTRSFQTGGTVLPARSAQLYTPAGYVPGTPVAFMVFHDGGAYINSFRIPVIFDKLIAAKKIPMMVGIFIPPGSRSSEYDTVSDRFGRFVIADVLPRVEALGVKLTTDPEASGAGGHSSGGICAFTMAWFHPDRFRRVLSNSGSFLSLQNPGGNLYDMLIRTTMPKKPIRTAMTAGTGDLACCGTTWYAANDRMYEALTAAGYNARYLVINGGSHDQSSPMPTTPELLEWLWRGYPVTGPTR